MAQLNEWWCDIQNLFPFDTVKCFGLLVTSHCTHCEVEQNAVTSEQQTSLESAASQSSPLSPLLSMGAWAKGCERFATSDQLYALSQMDDSNSRTEMDPIGWIDSSAIS